MQGREQQAEPAGLPCSCMRQGSRLCMRDFSGDSSIICKQHVLWRKDVFVSHCVTQGRRATRGHFYPTPRILQSVFMELQCSKPQLRQTAVRQRLPPHPRAPWYHSPHVCAGLASPACLHPSGARGPPLSAVLIPTAHAAAVMTSPPTVPIM